MFEAKPGLPVCSPQRVDYNESVADNNSKHLLEQ
jgi:hypothetical protein